MNENEFTNKLIKDIQSKNINVVNMGNGSFDLIIEGKRPFVCEIKAITKEGHRGFKENETGFSFTEPQTKEILKMKYPPFVVAFHDDDYYFFNPEWVKREVTDLKEYDHAIMYESCRYFPSAKNYNDLLDEIIKFVTV